MTLPSGRDREGVSRRWTPRSFGEERERERLAVGGWRLPASTGSWGVVLGLAFVTVLAYGRYIPHYDRPPALFWDENYFVPSAQRYLSGVFFMDQHPPLGKLFIALGEWLVRANPRQDQLIGTDYVRDVPPGFSFRGYRLVPVVLAWLTAPLVFLVFHRLTGRVPLATMLSFLYVFDNALIVHLRGAMLEGPLLFFVVLALFLFLVLVEGVGRPSRFVLTSLAFGMSLGLAVATKVLALLFVLLIPAGAVRLWPRRKRAWAFAGMATVGCLVAWCAVWQVHFTLGQRVLASLPNEGYYEASDASRRLLSEGRSGALAGFPVMLRDSWRYVWSYNRAVPRLDLCNPHENGSPPYLWPLGARAIRYRWETPDGATYRYLYLVANPVGWACGLLGVLLAGGLLLVSAFSGGRRPLRHGFELVTFLGLYLVYMLAVGGIGRVLYLYHYFIPLLMSFLLFGLSLAELRGLLGIELPDTGLWREAIVVTASVLLLVAHQAYRPLTYYQPLTDADFQRRAVLPIWDLHCARCSTESFWCRRPTAPVPTAGAEAFPHRLPELQMREPPGQPDSLFAGRVSHRFRSTGPKLLEEVEVA